MVVGAPEAMDWNMILVSSEKRVSTNKQHAETFVRTRTALFSQLHGPIVLLPWLHLPGELLSSLKGTTFILRIGFLKNVSFSYRAAIPFPS